MSPQDKISTIPEELLVCILEESGSNEYNLKMQSLVSKKFHQLTRPLFFKEVTMSYKQIGRYTQTLLLQPSFAKEVQVLTVNLTEYGFEKDNEITIPPGLIDFVERACKVFTGNAGFIETVSKELDRIVEPQVKGLWLSKLWMAGNTDGYLAILLCVLGKLEHLEVNFRSVRHLCNSFLDFVLNAVAYRPRTTFGLLRNLKTLSINYLDGSTKHIALSPLFGAPHLEELHIRSFGAISMPLKLDNKTLNITRIRLDCMSVDDAATSAATISQLIGACPKLASFSATYAIKQAHDEGWITKVRDALYTRTATLENLSLTPSLVEAENQPVRFETLKNFTKLKSLHLQEHLLLGAPVEMGAEMALAERLPASIEKLFLSQCTNDGVKSLVSVIEAGSEEFPALTQVGIDLGVIADYRDALFLAQLSRLEEMVDLFQAIGIDFIFKTKTHANHDADAALDEMLAENEMGADYSEDA